MPRGVHGRRAEPAAPPPVEDHFTADEPAGDYEERPARKKKRRREEDDYEPERESRNPGRGTMLLVFGIVSVVSAVLTGLCAIVPFVRVVSIVIPFIGLTFGILAWVMGSGDLKKINRGSISRNARGSTQGGFVCGIIGTILNSLILVCGCVGLIAVLATGFAFFKAASSLPTNRTNNTAPFGPPPGPRRPFQLAPTKLADYMPRIDWR